MKTDRRIAIISGGSHTSSAAALIQDAKIRASPLKGYGDIITFELKYDLSNPITHVALYVIEDSLFAVRGEKYEAYITAKLNNESIHRGHVFTIGSLRSEKVSSFIQVPSLPDLTSIAISVKLLSKEKMSGIKRGIQAGQREMGGFSELC